MQPYIRDLMVMLLLGAVVLFMTLPVIVVLFALKDSSKEHDTEP